MKLLSCYIEKYGRISQKEIKFNEGITEILEENGAGKSTLASFIKAMFYGLSSYTLKSKNFEDRQHYCPFGEKNFGGNITFEMQGNIYRIERSFDQKSEAKDDLRVYKNDIVTNEFGNEIGQNIFGIDEDSFKKTIFFTGNDNNINTTPSINSKLNAYSLDSSSENNFEKGIADLENAAKQLKPLRGTNGIIPSLQEKINNLCNIIDDLEKVNDALNEKYVTRTDLSNKVYNNEALIKKTQQKALLNEKNKTYKELVSQVENTGEKLKEIKEQYKNGLPSENEFEEYYALEKKEIVLCSKLDNIQENEKVLKQEAEKIKEKISQNETELEIMPEDDKKTLKPMIMCIIGILIMLIGIIVSVALKKMLISLISLSLGIIFILLFLPKIIAMQKAEKEKKQEWEKYNILVKKRQEDNKIAYDEAVKRCSEKGIEKELIVAEIDENEKKINELLNKYSLNRENVKEAEHNSKRIKEMTAMYKFHSSRAEKYKNDNDIDDNYNTEEISDIEVLNQQQNDLRKKLAEIDRQILQDEMLTEQLEGKYRELEEAKEKLEKSKRKYDILEKTIKCLKETETNVQNQYVLPVRESFCKYSNMVMPEASEKIVIDSTFEVQYDEKGAYRNNKHLSAGQRSVWALCYRLALIDNMYKSEKPFIILDDPFVNLDEKNIKGMKEVISKISQEIQILYFSCHSSRKLEV